MPQRLLPLALLLLAAACGGSPPASSGDAGNNPGGNADAGNGNPDAGNGNPDAGNGNPDAGNGNPGGNADAGNGNPGGNSDGGTPPPLDGGTTPGGTDRNVVTYAGDSGNERFTSSLVLSDGTVLVAGGATSLNWVPASVPRTQLPATGIDSASAGNIGFILHLSQDLRTLLRVVHFPAGAVRDIRRLRTTSLPGQPTGDLFISGARDTADATKDGYFLARLNGNFVTAAPTGLAWAYNAECRPRSSTSESEYKRLQPWDVGGDGRVVFGRGLEFDPNWAIIERLSPQGQRELVPGWTAHWTASGTEYDGRPEDYSGTAPLAYSGIVMKAGRRGSLRSWTQADFDVLLPDGNGRNDRKGRYPDDSYFSGPCNTTACPGGPGYTGYRLGANPTQRVGGIVVDRRNGDVYFGYSTQSTLPDGNPDFEPAVVAMDATGRLKWWSRLYHERIENNSGGYTTTSSPDQYVDHVALDYASNRLVVLARAHGNNTINLWSGNKVAARPNATSFHNGFTGTNGNIHISWLGKLDMADGNLWAASWVAEYTDDATLGAPYADPLLDGWGSHNAGWPNLNTTRVAGLEVDAQGAVYLVAQGRRTVTTSNAYMRMYKPSEGRSGWNYFVRVFTADLSTLRYSSILRGPWDAAVDGGGENVVLQGVVPVQGGVLAVGYHRLDSATNQALGVAMPVSQVPAWGVNTPAGESAVLAHLRY